MNAPILAALTNVQSALAPAGEQASRITGLWWFYLAILAGVYLLVLAALFTGIALRWRKADAGSAPAPARERTLHHTVLGATVVTVVLLFVLLFADIFTERAVSSPAPADALVISLTGRQWWWDVRYEDAQPSRIVTVANELHIPAGKPVKFQLQSSDVIHSFWVPNLHGKKDLIPGHPTSTWFTATRPGTYFGQCAEFCGYEHALMRLSITVDPPEQFAAWLETQRNTPPPPQTAALQQGQRVFLGTTCVMCHAIQGTPARATFGPDLTHLASRQTIASGALPNTPETLAAWITDPQAHKPGVRMPQHTIPPEELRALVAYLTSLR